VNVDKILANNLLQVDWPLQIGQKLVIDLGNFTPSPTPRPLTPIEKLTPESDGKYYHTVSSGETLSWISSYYGVSMGELMAWNGLSASSIIIPGQKLLLQVTPPATETPVPPPATSTPHPTVTHTPSPTVERTTTQALVPSPTATGAQLAAATPFISERMTGMVILVVALAAGGLIAAGYFMRRKR
jgi:LysM repeat protein